MTASRFAEAGPLADAVMYEGYVLYPYRKSALKNAMRWNFGVIAPREPSGRADDWFAFAECLIEPRAPAATLTVLPRFLHLQRRTIQLPTERGWQRVDRAVVAGRDLISWEEAVPCELPNDAISLEALRVERAMPFSVAGVHLVEEIRDASGSVCARIVRERQSVELIVRLSSRPVDERIWRVHVRIENAATREDGVDSPAADPTARALIGCHALLAVDGGGFLSQIDPPEHAKDAAAQCSSRNWWPVLVGSRDAQDTMLCAPIILYDYPALAPETRGDFFDATEIDEMLTLRVMTLTEAEKREMAATDERARHILARVEETAPDDRSLEGAIRRRAEGDRGVAWEALLNPTDLPSPEHASCVIGSGAHRVHRVHRGSRVRLAPRGGADAMDMFLAGRTATVAGVYQDVDERTHVAVTLDDDPLADLRRDVGRYFYFAPDELTPDDGDGHV